MSRKRVEIRPRTGGSGVVSLFPFLAVLLCTMGALIMLLVVIARNVRESVDQPLVEIVAVSPESVPLVEEQTVPMPIAVPIPISVKAEKIETAMSVNEELPTENESQDESRLTVEQAAEILHKIKTNTEEADWFAENLEKSKNSAEQECAQARALLASAEKNTQQHKEELTRLLQLGEQLGREETGTVPDIEQLKAMRELGQTRLNEVATEIDQLQKDAEQNSKSYAIIPFKGKDGTFRRPVYIECFEDRVVIQPEGVVLHYADFMGGDAPDNPFDAVLRAVRQYYVENNQLPRGTEPYPLLIVRPSGVQAYAAVRRAMGTWVNEFGYELVEEDWKIEYPAPSEELRGRIDKQLETSRRRLAGYLAAQEVIGEGTKKRTRQYRADSQGMVPLGQSGMARPGYDISLRQQQTGYGGQSTGSTSLVDDEKLYGMTRPESLAEDEYTKPGPHSVSPGNPYAAPYATPYAAGLLEQAANENAVVVQEQSTGNITGTNGANGAEGTANSSSAPSPIVFGPMPTMSGMPAVELGASTNPAMNQQEFPEQTSSAKKKTPKDKEKDEKRKDEKRPDNWALRNVKPFSAAVKRNVKIQCDANNFVLLPQTGLIGMRVVPITESVYTSTDQLVAEIWDFMESWGTAGEKYFWQPVLQVKVASGGEQRFEELRWILRGSGLVIERIE